VAAVLLLLAVTACTDDPGDPSSTSTPPASTPSPDARGSALVFGDCGERIDLASVQLPEGRTDRLTFACADLDVPLDHGAPDGEQLAMAVVRIRDADQHDRIGSLVMNPGGPGNPGLGWAAYWAGWLPDEILERFDVVTFDPRGTGLSEGINCPDLPEADEPGRSLDVTSSGQLAKAARLLRRQSEACAERVGPQRLTHFNTTATAHDLDLLRAALGDEALTYLGFSYGAKLGAAYAHLFPARVRALVLDSPSDPAVDALTVAVRQAAGFEKSLVSWVEDCPNRPTCTRLGEAREALATLVERADAKPIPSGRPIGDVPMSGSDVLFAVVGLLYSSSQWPLLDDALAEAMLGDSGSLHEAIDQNTGRVHDDTSPDAGEAGDVINCNDAAPGPARRQIAAAGRRLASRAPTFAPVASWWLLGCSSWTVERHVLELPTAPDAPPLLVVGTTHDPATPYAGAVSLTRTLGSGHLLTWEGQGHTAYGQSACINDLVDGYLLQLTMPADGTRCPG